MVQNSEKKMLGDEARQTDHITKIPVCRVSVLNLIFANQKQRTSLIKETTKSYLHFKSKLSSGEKAFEMREGNKELHKGIKKGIP